MTTYELRYTIFNGTKSNCTIKHVVYTTQAEAQENIKRLRDNPSVINLIYSIVTEIF